MKNAQALYRSYKKARKTGIPEIKGMPLSISIEPTTACNLGCPECPSGLKQFTRDTGNLKLDFFRKTLQEVKQDLLYMNFYFQGEPFINPQFLEMVKAASNEKIYTSTSTNAHFISENIATQVIHSGLDRVIVSIDGTTQEVYEKYRINGYLDKVLEGTNHLVEAKRKHKKGPHIVFQFLVVRHNEHQIEEAKQLAKKMKVDAIQFKTAQIYDYKHGSPLIPENPKYSRYAQQADGTYTIKNKLLNQCWRMWHSCVITWDGLIVPCCFDKDAKHQLGDLKTTAFEAIWKGDQYHHFRSAILKSRNAIDICTNCTEGTKVWR